jgi:RNA polymerase sigma-70 factor (ECF subfamily)
MTARVAGSSIEGLLPGRFFVLGQTMPHSTTVSQQTPSHEMAPLLRRCGEGDPAAWDRLLTIVRRLALDLGRWKYRLVQEDAEDLAQVVQVRVAQRLPQLRDPGAFPGWVRQLTHHAAVDVLRRQRACLSLDEPLPAADTAAVIETEERYDQIVLRTDLDRALARLPAHYREPIELHLLEGMPQDEVGRLLGRPRSTVASQIERGLRRLQRTLAPAMAG